MDRGLCTRCAHFSLRPRTSLHRAAQSMTPRTFATTIRAYEDEPGKRSTQDNKSSSQQSGVRTNASTTRPATVVNSPPQGGLLIRRTSSPSGPPSASRTTRPTGPPGGLLIRRDGQLPPQRGAGEGQILRRTGPPRQGGRPGARGGAQGGQRGPPGRMRRRQTAESVRARESEDTPASQQEIDDYMTKYIDRPANPTEPLDYNPKPETMLELQKDWPNTPLSATGLSASVTQQIEGLAKRIAHGYKTHEELAEHFHQGNLTRFQSEEEKEQVIKLATELAQKRASLLSERKGSEVAVEDMTLSALSSRDEKKNLIGKVVKGEVGELERQRMPFLDSIMRNLRNNQTYHQTEMEGFMKTVQRLMPAQTQRRPQQQAQKKA